MLEGMVNGKVVGVDVAVALERVNADLCLMD